MEDMGPELSDAQIDQLVNTTEGSESQDVFPMGEHPPQEAQTQVAQAQAAETQKQAPSAQDQFVITHNGKPVVATLDQLKQWAQMGYDYPQKMQAFKQEQEAWKPYREIDEYAKTNPEWWAFVDKAWNERGKAAQPSNPLQDPNNPLVKEIEELKSFKEQYLNEKMTAQRQAEDEALVKDISSMREQFKHLDWNTPDQRGYDMEMQVLNYARENGIGNFKQAFQLYNYDRLLSLAEERGKEAVVKDQQKKTKLGLIGPDQSPGRGITPAKSLKNKSYSDLAQEALDELGITG